MPRSPNRRTVEVSAETYDHLRTRADQRGESVAAVVRALLIDGETVEDWHTAHDAMLRDTRDRLRDLAADVQDLTAQVHALAATMPGGTPEPPPPATSLAPPPRKRTQSKPTATLFDATSTEGARP